MGSRARVGNLGAREFQREILPAIGNTRYIARLSLSNRKNEEAG
jgi:hypothetical protein